MAQKDTKQAHEKALLAKWGRPSWKQSRAGPSGSPMWEEERALRAKGSSRQSSSTLKPLGLKCSRMAAAVGLDPCGDLARHLLLAPPWALCLTYPLLICVATL